MSSEKRFYIAHKYYAQNYGSKSIYEEAIFETYDSAYEYIKKISEEENDRFLSEIISYLLNDIDSWKNEQRWTFDRKANLVKFHDARKERENWYTKGDFIYQKLNPDSFTQKFFIGDIVSVKAFPWNEESPIPEKTFGVIGVIPSLLEEWINNGKNKEEWDNKYVVYFISNGCVCHMHITECNIEHASQEIPQKLIFLKTLSAHLKKKIKIEKNILNEIFNGKIFVENIRYFDNQNYNTK